MCRRVQTWWSSFLRNFLQPPETSSLHGTIFSSSPHRGASLDMRGKPHKTQINKKFCEELVAYFPWYDMDRTENDVPQQFFYCCVSAVTFLPSRCLATMGVFLPNRAVT
jgi:hypothetical protein